MRTAYTRTHLVHALHKATFYAFFEKCFHCCFFAHMQTKMHCGPIMSVPPSVALSHALSLQSLNRSEPNLGGWFLLGSRSFVSFQNTPSLSHIPPVLSLQPHGFDPCLHLPIFLFASLLHTGENVAIFFSTNKL